MQKKQKSLQKKGEIRMSNGIVLGIKKAKPTGKAIAKILKCKFTTGTIDINHKYDFVFRYGNTTAWLETSPRIVINSMRSILLASNKPQFRFKLIMSGVPAPKLYSSESIDSAVFPVIARPVHHYRGKNFNIVETKDNAIQFLRSGHYIQEMIDKDKEYRFFVFNDKILEASEKERVNTDSHPIIWGHEFGWNFVFCSLRNVNQNLKDYARMAARVSELNFCAVDCCIDKNGNPYILEINSAPGLIDRKAEKFALRIREWLQDKGVIFTEEDNVC